MIDARKAVDFFKSRLGLMALAAVGLALLLLWVGDLRRNSEARNSQATNDQDRNPIGAPLETITRPDPGQLAPESPTVPPAREDSTPATAAQPSESKPTARKEDPDRPRERIALFDRPAVTPSAPKMPDSIPAVPNPTPAVQPGIRPFSERFAPYGRAIPCQLLFTVDSSRVETPVVGVVTQDVWWNGDLIIPAGSEAHGTAQVDYQAGRIRAEGAWIVVLPGFSDVVNGAEIVVNAAALARDEGVNRAGQISWGIDDGSFGMLGRTIRSDNWQELKIFLATFLGAAAATLESRDPPIISPFGGSAAQGPVQSTPTNAALGGLAAVVNQYAQQIQGEIAQNGFYTRVQSGTQFYLYVRQTIDLADARIGDSEGIRVAMENRRARLDLVSEEAARQLAISQAVPGATIIQNDSPTFEEPSPVTVPGGLTGEEIEELGRLIERMAVDGQSAVSGIPTVPAIQEEF